MIIRTIELSQVAIPYDPPVGPYHGGDGRRDRATNGASSLLAAPKQKIASVRVWPVNLSINLGGTFQRAAPKFSSDFDPRRWRSFGPFSQLIGAIMDWITVDADRSAPAPAFVR